jgi:DNA-binding CsgD family transcriptional regulator
LSQLQHQTITPHRPTDQPVPVTVDEVAAAWARSTDDDATRVYLTLVRMPNPTRELLLAQGIPASRLDACLKLLEERGLASLSDDGTIEVPPPQWAIPRFADNLERRAKSALAAKDALARVYHAARNPRLDPMVGVEILADLDDVGSATNQAVAGARERVWSMRAMTARTRELMDSPLPSHRERSIGAGGRVVAMHTVWDAAVLEQPHALEVLEARRQGAEVQRVLASIPLTVIVIDDSTCIVEWSSHRHGPQGLLGHTPAAVAAGTALVERFWQLGTPMGHQADGTGLDDRDATVLRLMAAGVPDAAIARQTGFSQRTVERRIRHVMELLGSQTRFQAGVQAVQRGWL